MKKMICCLLISIFVLMLSLNCFGALSVESISTLANSNKIPFDLSIVNESSLNSMLNSLSRSLDGVNQMIPSTVSVELSMKESSTSFFGIDMNSTQMTISTVLKKQEMTINDVKVYQDFINSPLLMTENMTHGFNLGTPIKNQFRAIDQVVLNDVEIGMFYNFQIEMEVHDCHFYYVGWLECNLDNNNELYLNYHVTDVSSILAPNSTSMVLSNDLNGQIMEYENIDTTPTTPQYGTLGRVMCGSVYSTNNDVDAYLYQAITATTIHFTLSSPNSVHTLLVSDYETNQLLFSATASPELGASFTLMNVPIGKTYIVHVLTISGNIGTPYYLSTTQYVGKAWFPSSQTITTSSGTLHNLYLWNSMKLPSTYAMVDNEHYPASTSTTFMMSILRNRVNNLYDSSKYAMSSGCYLSCYAMVLANLNRQTNVLMNDFRLASVLNVSGYRYFLKPDPFVLLLVNNSCTGYEFVAQPRFIGSTYFDEYLYTGSTPLTANIINHNNLASMFGTTTTCYYFNNYNSSSLGIISDYSTFDWQLSSILDNNPQGVIIGSSGHKVVVTKEGGEYYVYDPYSSEINERYRMPLSVYMTSSYGRFTYSDIILCRVITPNVS